jgi:hypothetical protein
MKTLITVTQQFVKMPSSLLTVGVLSYNLLIEFIRTYKVLTHFEQNIVFSNFTLLINLYTTLTIESTLYS